MSSNVEETTSHLKYREIIEQIIQISLGFISFYILSQKIGR